MLRPRLFCVLLASGAAVGQGRSDAMRELSPGRGDTPSRAGARIVVNEIMYAPVAPEPEWIELFNAGDEPADISGWSVSDADTSARKPLPAAVRLVGAGEFALLTRDTLALLARRAVPGGLLVQLSAFPSLNNAGDLVAVYDPAGTAVDRVRYAPPGGTSGTGGRSLERVDPEEDSSREGNWLLSRAAAGATPCAPNSVLRLVHDVALRAILPVVLRPLERQALQVRVLNRGRNPAGPIEVSLFDDVSGDSLPDPPELLAVEIVGGPIAPGDSTVAALIWEAPPPGRHGLIALARYDADGRPQDNQVSFPADVAYPSGWVVMNEFLYEPLPGGSEFVELLNVCDRPVEMAGWSLTDARGRTPRATLPPALLLRPGDVLVVAVDSSLLQSFPELAGPAAPVVLAGSGSLGLNNDGDTILLLDPVGHTVDSLAYTPLWHNSSILDHAGRSLEKLYPRCVSYDAPCWSTCVDVRGGTPGRQNSIFTPPVSHAVQLSVSPNPFSPDDDGHEDFTWVQYTLPSLASSLSIAIFDTSGRRRRLLQQREAAGPRGDAVWDGRDDDRRRVGVGAYIIVLEAFDTSGATLLKARSVAYVAGRL